MTERESPRLGAIPAERGITDGLPNYLSALRTAAERYALDRTISPWDRSLWRRIAQAAEMPLAYQHHSPEASARLLVGLLRHGDLRPREILALLIRGMGFTSNPQKVVALSPFSWGKSTLLNALIGEELLHADHRAETARVTRILHSKHPFLVLSGDDGLHVQSASSPQLLAQALEEHTSVRFSQAHEQEIYAFLPLPPRLRHLELVDTPGYFSRFPEHDRLADSTWPQADLVLAVIDPEKVGESNFTAKLRLIQKASRRTLYVVTKRDRIREGEEALIAELQHVLGVPRADILCVSGYFGMYSRIWCKGRKSLEEVRRNRTLVYEDHEEGLVAGGTLSLRHAARISEYSNIDTLERRISAKTGGRP